jgi:Cu/Ag efflux protein CusF
MKQPAIQAMIVLLLSTVACNRGANQPTVAMPAQATAKPKRYHLKGKVVSVDKQAHMLSVDGEAIPGVMSAMTMAYSLKPEAQLGQLSPGDAITADVIVQGDDSWLENITVTGHDRPTK